MQSLAIVCVRALGAYILIVFLSSLGLILGTQLLVRDLGAVQARTLIVPAAMSVVGLVLIVSSRSFARLLTAGVPELQAPALDASQVLQLGTALLGVFFLASAAPTLASAAGHYFAAVNGCDDLAGANADRIRAASTAFSGVGSAAIGALLLWMSRGGRSRNRAPAGST